MVSDCIFQFQFRHKTFTAKAYFSFEKKPWYIFVHTGEGEFRRLYDEEISIKTDGETLLQKDDDHHPNMLALRRAIFDAIKVTPEFLKAKAERSGASQ